MRITNKTDWRSDHLRAIITRVAQDELDPAARKRVRVEITYTRTRKGGSSGCATIGGSWCRVRVSRNWTDPIDFAYVTAHEFAHTRGMHHDKMRGSPRYRRVGNYTEIYAWAAALPLEKKPGGLYKCEERNRGNGWGYCPNRAVKLVATVIPYKNVMRYTRRVCAQHEGRAPGVYPAVAHGPGNVRLEGTATVSLIPMTGPSRAEKLATRRDAKLDAARAMTLKWERRMKLAQTKLKKWRRRAAALERHQQAASRGPQEG